MKLNYFRTFSFNQYLSSQLKNVLGNIENLFARNQTFIDKGGNINSLINSNQYLIEHTSNLKNTKCGDIQLSILKILKDKEEFNSDFKYIDSLNDKLNKCYKNL